VVELHNELRDLVRKLLELLYVGRHLLILLHTLQSIKLHAKTVLLTGQGKQANLQLKAGKAHYR
jgi:hypothetical protein